jgi:hypothetical protein
MDEVFVVHTICGDDEVIVLFEQFQLIRLCPVQLLNLHISLLN